MSFPVVAGDWSGKMTLADREQDQEESAWPEGAGGVPPARRRAPGARGSPGSGRVEGRKGWESSILRQGGAGGGMGQKPEGDITDLLIMSTLDQKAPPPAVGSADLLDTLVQDHLARTETSRAQAEELSLEEALSQLGVDAAPAAPVAAAPAAAEAVDAEDSVQLLQREIETLLRGDAAVDAEPAAREAEESALAEATASAEADPAMLLEAELRTLLPGAGAAPAAEVTAAAAPERFSDLPGEEGFLGDGDDVGDETARQLSEAEGVLAAELAQLMAEATTAPKAAPLPAAAESVSAPAAVAAEAAAVKPVVASAAVVAPTAAVGGPATGQVPAVISAATMPPPVVIELPETDAEAELSGAAPRLGIVAQVRQVVMGVLLLIAQLIDMPFAKINDMDKNVLGFVAFLLLLSGCVMYWLSLIYK